MQTVVKQENLAEELSQLEEMRDALQEEITKAQFSKDEAIAKYKRTGEYAENGWFLSLTNTIRSKTIELHSTNRAIKALRRRMNGSNPKAAFFQQAAKEILESDVYAQIEDLAEQYISEARS